jgi:hypothetical protein
MRLRILFRNQLINLDADPDFYLIQVTKMMRIRIWIDDTDVQYGTHLRFSFSGTCSRLAGGRAGAEASLDVAAPIL